MKIDTDLKKAFIAAIAGGDARTAQVLAGKIRAQNKPVLCLNIAFTDGIYTIDSKQYNKPQLEALLTELRKDHNIRFQLMDNSPGENHDFIYDYTSGTDKEVTGMVIL